MPESRLGKYAVGLGILVALVLVLEVVLHLLLEEILPLLKVIPC